MKTAIALSTLIASATLAAPAFAGSVDDFAGTGFRKSHGSSHTVTNMHTTREYSENGSFSGQQSQTNVDYVGLRGDFKFNDNGVWAEGTSKFSLQQSESKINYDFSEAITQSGDSRTVATDGYVDISNGYVIDANVNF